MVKELNKPKTKRRNRYILRICYAETSTDLIAFEQDHFKSVVPCLQKKKLSPALLFAGTIQVVRYRTILKSHRTV